MYIIRNSFVLLFLLIIGFFILMLPLQLKFLPLTLFMTVLFELINLYYRKVILTVSSLILIGGLMSYVFIFKLSGDYTLPITYVFLILVSLIVFYVIYNVTRKWDGLSWFIKGFKLIKREKYYKAIEYFDKALELGTDELLTLFFKGDTLLDISRYDEALQCFDDALNVKPNNWRPNENKFIALLWICKGIGLTGVGKYEEAMGCYDNSLKYSKLSSMFAFRGATFFEMGMENKAIECVEMATKKGRRIAAFWSMKGLLLLEIHRFDEALTCIEKSLKLNSKTSAMWNPKGLFFAEMGQYEEALKFYDKALDLNPENVNSMCYKSETLLKMGKHEEALEYCDHALEISPKSKEVWFYRGIILTKMDKFEEALESYDRSLSLNPRNLKTLNKRIQLLNGLKEEYSYEDYRNLIDKSLLARDFDDSVEKFSFKKPPEKMVKCPSCGEKVAKNARKCPKCGFELKKPIDTSEPASVTLFALIIISIFTLGTGGYFLLEKPKMAVAVILFLIFLFKVINPSFHTLVACVVVMVAIITVHQYTILKSWKNECNQISERSA